MSLNSIRKKIRFLLFPFSLFYGIGIAVRNFCFNRNIIKQIEFDIPVISVGNITVGGTGKTPHIEYLICLLKDEFKIATLSRGYKRKTKGYILADRNSTPETIGDEPFQLFEKFPDINVAVAEKRVEGIQKLKSSIKGLKVVLLDDAFQHRYVKPGLSIVLIDYSRPVFKDYLLPAGDLRENPSGLHRANIVIVTKTPPDIKPIEKRIWSKELDLFPYQFLYFSTIHYENPISVFSPEKKLKPENLKKDFTDVLLLTGIANPSPIKKHLRHFSLKVHSLEFSDHHKFTSADIEKVETQFKLLPRNKSLVLTTSKDAVRLRFIEDMPEKLKKNLYYLPIQIRILGKKQKEFNDNIIKYVKTNKRVGPLHS